MPQTPQDLLDRVQPKISRRASEMPELETPSTEIIVYICPTPECDNHIAAPNFRPDKSNIESMQYVRSQNDGSQNPSHNRIECPACRTIRGIHVQRVPYVVVGIVPLKKVLQVYKAQDELA